MVCPDAKSNPNQIPERPMKKLIAVTAFSLMCSAAFAQTSTGPAGQTDVNKPGMNTNMDKGSMGNGTTGMSDKGSMSKDGMKKDSMSKDGMKKDGMKK
jgi:pentapeptide MXKDX repeat protein